MSAQRDPNDARLYLQLMKGRGFRPLRTGWRAGRFEIEWSGIDGPSQSVIDEVWAIVDGELGR